MPSAVPRSCAPRLWVRIACEIAGVGVKPSSASTITSTPCGAEHLDDGLRRGLGERVRVAPEEERAVDALLPCGSGRSPRRSASTWASLNVRAVEVPRCPEVPNATRWPVHGRVRPLVEVGADEGVDVDEVGRVRQLPGVLAHAHAPVTYPVGAVATLVLRMLAASPRPVSHQSSIAPEDVILVGGEALYDLVYDGDEDLQGHPGGAAFNTARTIGRLGQPVAYLGRLSTDRFGTRLERMLAADGVRLDAVVRTDEPTTLALAELDETGSARYRFYERATSAPGPDAGGRARRAARRRRDPARRHPGPDARADGRPRWRPWSRSSAGRRS